jgi:outer membrane protein assembly factor BamB
MVMNIFVRGVMMLKAIKISIFVIGLMCICILSGNITVAGQVGLSKDLVSKELLDHARLKLVWSNKLPMNMKKNEVMARMFITGDNFYALSSYNYMVGMDMSTGAIKFSKAVAGVGLPVEEMEYYQGKLISLTGSNLVEMEPDTGVVLSSRVWKLGLTCPVVRNKSFYYIGATDKRVHVLRSEDRVQTFELAAESDAMITSIVADEGFIIFSTDAGDVISAGSNAPVKLWAFNAADSVIGPMVRTDNAVIFSSKDTNVYCLDVYNRGELIWKYQTAAILDKAPVVTESIVYQRVSGKGLIAIEKGSGKLMWELDGGLDLLAESKNKAYVITETGKLVVIDNVKKKKLYSTNLASVTQYAVNTVDSKIYIGDSTGSVMCLKPIE